MSLCTVSLFRTIGVLTIVGVSVAAVASGCGGPETEQATPSPLNTEQGFCDALAAAICNAEVVEACYLADAESLDENTEECVDLASKSAVCNPSNHSYNKDAADACLQAVTTLYADARLEQSELDEAREACLDTFPGSGSLNADCVVHEDCNGADGLRCVGKPGQDATCQAPVEIEPAGDCSAADAVCPDDLYCDSPGEHCVAKQGAGDSCDDTALCDASAQCAGGLCVSKLANGEVCSADGECSGGFCVKKTGENTGQCGSFIPLTFDSAACEPLTP